MKAADRRAGLGGKQAAATEDKGHSDDPAPGLAPAVNRLDLVLVHTTCGSREQALELARKLVDERLVACASLGAIVESVYPWAGRIEQNLETPLTLKTTATRLPALKRRLLALHPYENPEWLVFDAHEAGEAYAQWVGEWVHGG